jgi:hypothetical protein
MLSCFQQQITTILEAVSLRKNLKTTTKHNKKAGT